MSEGVTLNIEGRRVTVDPSFLELSPDEQQAAVEEIAVTIGARGPNVMGNVNQGIAESVGGITDFFNPFDRPHMLNPFPQGTGSAVAGLERGMDAAGIGRAAGEPRTGAESFARGAGQAAGALVPAGATARALSATGGLLGRVMGDASRTINSAGGTFSELLAGGAARTAQDAAERAGAPQWQQDLAGLAGGFSTAALPYVATRTPSALGGRMAVQWAKRTLSPYTEKGAQEVARQRVQELAGGPERAGQLAAELSNGTEIGLTPAQVTDDPNMRAIEQTAARQNPALRDRLERRAEESVETARTSIPGAGADVEATQGFFEQRRQDALTSLQQRVDRATRGALRPEARNPESVNSEAVAQQLRAAEAAADREEARLWGEVPRGVQVPTDAAKRAAEEMIRTTPRAQQNDIPPVIRQLLDPEAESGFGGRETVAEMHGLYSELRRAARSAMAGSDQNRNAARIANGVARAILDDLGAYADDSAIGQAINAARAYSVAKHETFDQGTVGRLLKRTLDGDEMVDPRLTLDNAIGRGGAAALVGYEDMLKAADTDPVQAAAEDYLTARFDRAAFGPEGRFNEGAARNFLRDNAETLDRMPYLRETLDEAIRTQRFAASVTRRASQVASDSGNPRKSAIAGFSQAAPENAVDQVFKARRPSLEARRLALTARKDETGQAVAGLKGAFSDYLIRRSTTAGGLSGERLREMLQTPETRLALTYVYEPAEIRRMDILAAELTKLANAQKAAPDIGRLSNTSPNRLIEIAGRILAARHGAQAGGGAGGSIQTAGIASGAMKRTLGNLQNDKAEQLLMDAVEDPELFRLLLVDPGRVQLKPEQINRLAPYFTGAVAGMEEDQ